MLSPFTSLLPSACRFLVMQQRSIGVHYINDDKAREELLRTETYRPGQGSFRGLTRGQVLVPPTGSDADPEKQPYLTVQYMYHEPGAAAAATDCAATGEEWAIDLQELHVLFHPRLSLDIATFFVPPAMPGTEELAAAAPAAVAAPVVGRTTKFKIRGVYVKMVTTGGQHLATCSAKAMHTTVHHYVSGYCCAVQR